MTLAREQGGCLSRRCIELSLAVYIIMERGEGNKTTRGHKTHRFWVLGRCIWQKKLKEQMLWHSMPCVHQSGKKATLCLRFHAASEAVSSTCGLRMPKQRSKSRILDLGASEPSEA